MFVERFSEWYFTQPELVQQLVLYGPPLAVSLIISKALGGGLRRMVLAWMYNPTVAAAMDEDYGRKHDDAGPDWTEAAKASVDEEIARRRRGLH